MKILNLPNITANSHKNMWTFLDIFNFSQDLKAFTYDTTEELTIVMLILRKIDTELSNHFENTRSIQHRAAPTEPELIQ